MTNAEARRVDVLFTHRIYQAIGTGEYGHIRSTVTGARQGTYRTRDGELVIVDNGRVPDNVRAALYGHLKSKGVVN